MTQCECYGLLLWEWEREKVAPGPHFALGGYVTNGLVYGEGRISPWVSPVTDYL